MQSILAAAVLLLAVLPLSSSLSVVLVGHFADASGMGEEGRQFAFGLSKLGVDLKLVTLRTTSASQALEIRKEEQYLIDSLHTRELTKRPVIALYVVVPEALLTAGTTIKDIDKEIGVKVDYRIARVVFETDGVPETWIALLSSSFHSLILTSSFLAKNFARGGVPKHLLRQLPEPLDLDLFSEKSVDERRRDEFRSYACGNYGKDSENPCFVFVSVFDWQWRKGWNILLYAFLSEFSNQPNVRLLIKPSANFRAGLTLEGIKMETRQFAKHAGFIPKTQETGGLENIVFMEESMASADLPNLYAAADVFVLPTRGEGWGRPICEAMAMGLPAVVTGWGGHTEFATADHSFHIDYTLEDARDPNVRFFEDSGRWAKPNAGHLQTLMRNVYLSKEKQSPLAEFNGKPTDLTANDIARRGQEFVRARYATMEVAENLLGQLKEIARSNGHDEL